MNIDLTIALTKLNQLQLQLEDGDLGAQYWRQIGQLLQDADSHQQRDLNTGLGLCMTQLNQALEIALAHSAGSAQAFAFHLTAPLAGWMAQGFLDEDTAMAAMRLLHQLHPEIRV